MGLASNLAAAFWKLSAESEDADGDDCSGALASVGCLRAVATILVGPCTLLGCAFRSSVSFVQPTPGS